RLRRGQLVGGTEAARDFRAIERLGDEPVERRLQGGERVLGRGRVAQLLESTGDRREGGAVGYGQASRRQGGGAGRLGRRRGAGAGRGRRRYRRIDQVRDHVRRQRLRVGVGGGLQEVDVEHQDQ